MKNNFLFFQARPFKVGNLNCRRIFPFNSIRIRELFSERNRSIADFEYHYCHLNSSATEDYRAIKMKMDADYLQKVD